MKRHRARRQRQRDMLHWAQGGICAGCGKPMASKGQAKREPSYPTFDHVDPRELGGLRSVANGLLKHRRCNDLRNNRLPSGCDLIWHWSVLDRLRSNVAIERWGEALSPVFYPGWRPEFGQAWP
jgi:5-methylcytosine-specific restriction endonuclease McrA